MIDKIVIVNEHEALIVFTDRAPFTLRYDKDIKLMVLWFLNSPNVELQLFIDGTNDLAYVSFSDEDTQDIDIRNVA
jgi:hypothetical protein